MTEEELELIVRKHEMRKLELKESFGNECIETACAFANAEGGLIVIGVDDKGNPSKRQLRHEALRDYENRISTATEPAVAVDAEKVSFHGRDVVVIKVQENPIKPVAFKGRCFLRKGSVSHQMTPSEVAECHLKSTGASMDAVPVPNATKADLDMDAVRRYMELATENKRRTFNANEDPWDVLLKLEWVKSEHEISRAAYLMFAKDTQRKFSQAIVHAGAFKAEGAVIIDSFDARGNIQTQVDATLAFIQRNIHCAIQTHPGSAAHEAVWDYPLEAVRETIANAICHRDYGSPHDVQVKILEDMLQISSPGQLPFDMPLELLMNPLHASRPRNKIIAQAFFDMGIIEHYGRGIIRIKEECDKNGNPYPAWKDEYGSFVTEYIPRIAHSRNVQTTTLPVQTTTVPVQTTTVRGQTAILPAQTTTAQKQSDTALPEELLAELGSLGKKAPSNRIADLMVRLCEHRPMTKKDLMRHLKRGEATINRIAASLLGTRLAYRYPNMIHHPRQAYVAVATTILKETQRDA